MIKKIIKIIKSNKILFVFIVIALGFFYKIIIHPTHMLYGDDIYGVYSFWRSFLVESVLKYHTLPLWNPYNFSGMPFLGDPESGIFYPFTYFFYIIPVNLTFGYLFILDFIFMGIFTYFFAKRIGLSNTPSFITTICMVFSAPFLMYIYQGHLFVMDSIVWFPLLLLIYEHALQKRSLSISFLSIIPFSLMLVGGHIQPALFGWTALYLYLILRNFFLWKEKNKTFLKILLSPIILLLLSCGISAAYLIPTIELTKLSIRNGGLSFGFASDFSLPPKQLITLFLPHFFGSPLTQSYWGKGNFWSTSIYMGIFPIALATIGLLLKRNKYVFIFLLLGLFALFYSFGPYGFVYPLFFKFVPSFNLFRVQARFLYVFSFALSIIAGFGTEYLLNKHFVKKQEIKLRKIVFLLFGTGVISSFIGIYLYFSKDSLQLFESVILKNSYAWGIDHKILLSQVTADLILFSLLTLFSSLLIFLVINRRLSSTKIIYFMTILILSDLWFFGMKFYSTKNPKDVFEKDSTIELIKKDNGTFRVFDMTGKLNTQLNNARLESLTGINPSIITKYQQYMWSTGRHLNDPYQNFLDIYTIENPTLLSLLNVKYIISTASINNSQFELITKDKYFVYKMGETLPRAYFVPNARIIPENKILTFLKKDNFNPKNEILLSSTPQNASLQNPGTYSRATIISRSPNSITVKIDATSPGFLVLSEIYYPGWEAYENTTKIEILQADYLFRSIFIKKGEHKITFKYNPQSYKTGKAISATIILLTATFFLVIYIRRKS